MTRHEQSCDRQHMTDSFATRPAAPPRSHRVGQSSNLLSSTITTVDQRKRWSEIHWHSSGRIRSLPSAPPVVSGPRQGGAHDVPLPGILWPPVDVGFQPDPQATTGEKPQRRNWMPMTSAGTSTEGTTV
jgi:hypothetical protein